MFAKDTESIDSIVKAFYEIVSGPKGAERQWERDKWIHAPNARILIPESSKPDTKFKVYTLDEYHTRAKRLVNDGFFEDEIHRITERFGRMAHVWSTYEWRSTLEGKGEGRGINTIQLFFSDERWWVSSWFFVSESAELPLPAKYLTN